MSDLGEHFLRVNESKRMLGQDGQELTATGGITAAEGEILLRLCRDTNAQVTLETGLAYGFSALVFLQHHKEGSRHGKHYAVDPDQQSRYKGSALRIIAEAGLNSYFEWLAGPSHLKLPKLIEAGVQLDCAFIDGMHLFDYTLIDFFLIDKMLRPGGLVAFHDMYGYEKLKALSFVLSHRDYEIAEEYRILDCEPWLTTKKFFVSRIIAIPWLITSRQYWRYQFDTSSGLVVVRKKSNFEPAFDFSARF